jgi:hypothetical protein
LPLLKPIYYFDPFNRVNQAGPGAKVFCISVDVHSDIRDKSLMGLNDIAFGGKQMAPHLQRCEWTYRP